MTEDAAARWLAAGRSPAWALPAAALLVVGGVWQIATSSGSTLDDAGGTDRVGDAMALVAFLVLLAAIAVGYWLWPQLAAVLGGLLSTALMLEDRSSSPAVLLAAAALMHLLGFVLEHHAGREQAAAARELGATPIPRPRGADLRLDPVLLSGVALLLLSAVAAGVWLSQEADLDDHRRAALTTNGDVVTHILGRHTTEQQIVLVDHTGQERKVRVEVSDELEIGTPVTVRYDPHSDWAELTDEPRTVFLAPALAALACALGLLALGYAAARLRPVGRTDEAVPVWCRIDHAGAQVRLSETGTKLTDMDFGWRLPGRPDVPFDARPDQWRPAHLVGRVSSGSRPVLVVDGQAARAVLPVVLPRPPSGPGDVQRAWAASKRGSEAFMDSPWLMLVIGPALLALSASTLPDAVRALHGDGHPGTVVINREDCSGRGGCDYGGDFVSADGRFAFDDVGFTGSGPIGSSQEAIYVGTGEWPSQVLRPGWADVRSGVLFSLAGAGMLLWGVVGLRRKRARRRERG